MECPDCGIQIGSLPCWRCEREAWDKEREIKSLIQEFSLVRGVAEKDEAKASLGFALECIQKRLANERFQMTIPYKAENLLRSETWWYVPYVWTGCRGFIVNVNDGYVNWLGSALSLQQCFWGHNRGVFCDLVDFTFSPDTKQELAGRMLLGFKHRIPNAHSVLPNESVFYEASEVSAVITNHFPNFRRHFVWFGIPNLMEAAAKEGLKFTCRLSETW